jgi:hypothetical protein
MEPLTEATILFDIIYIMRITVKSNRLIIKAILYKLLHFIRSSNLSKAATAFPEYILVSEDKVLPGLKIKFAQC